MFLPPAWNGLGINMRMKSGQYEFGQLMQGFIQGPLVSPKLQTDMLDAGFAQGFQFGDQSIATDTSAETMALHGCIGMLG
ncbi:hypothetical protein XGA_4169 [Xanthomonas hortorum ATCC 19865]|nr:hypothetical protein XGA_4169 [Xanthomonas hortorum ATCC 19865]